MAPVSLRLPPCSSIRRTNLSSQLTKNIHNRGRCVLIPVSAVVGDGSLINMAASTLVIYNKRSPVRHGWCVWCICCNSMQQDMCSNFGRYESVAVFPLIWQFQPELCNSTSANRSPKVSCLRLITAHSRPVIQDRITSCRVAMSHCEGCSACTSLTPRLHENNLLETELFSLFCLDVALDPFIYSRRVRMRLMRVLFINKCCFWA